jgi:hypothetical protein
MSGTTTRSNHSHAANADYYGASDAAPFPGATWHYSEPSTWGVSAGRPLPATDKIGERIGTSYATGADITTQRAEAIREATGCSWEAACQRAERERDADTSEDPASDHGYDVCPDCGNAGVKIGADGYESCTRFLTCWSDAR